MDAGQGIANPASQHVGGCGGKIVLEASLGYIVRSCLRNSKKEGRKGREKRRRRSDGGGRAGGQRKQHGSIPSVSSAQGEGIFLQVQTFITHSGHMQPFFSTPAFSTIISCYPLSILGPP